MFVQRDFPAVALGCDPANVVLVADSPKGGERLAPTEVDAAQGFSTWLFAAIPRKGT
jgi:hypothetical protein